MSKPLLAYQIHVQLQDTKPLIWRRLWVANTTTLAQLHRAIEAANGWQSTKAFAFEIAGQIYGVPDADTPEDRTMDARRYTLGQLLQGQPLPIRYRTGQHWLHRIKLEACTTVDKLQALQLPQCLAGRHASPPQHCPGPCAYQDLLCALNQKDHPAHAEAMAACPPGFEPKAFSLEAAQERLQQLMPVMATFSMKQQALARAAAIAMAA